MTASPWNKQQYELGVINDKFSDCLKKSRQLAECGEPYICDHAALTRQNDYLQGILDAQDSQLANLRSELVRKESKRDEELLELQRSERTMKDLQRRCGYSSVKYAYIWHNG
jgi:dynactin complex subunit